MPTLLTWAQIKTPAKQVNQAVRVNLNPCPELAPWQCTEKSGNRLRFPGFYIYKQYCRDLRMSLQKESTKPRN